MEIIYLTEEQLVFELTSRGQIPKSSKLQKVAQLRKVLKDASIEQSLTNIDWKTSEEQLNVSLHGIAQLIEDNLNEISDNKRTEVSSQIKHVENRLSLLRQYTNQEDLLFLITMLEAELAVMIGALDEIPVKQVDVKVQNNINLNNNDPIIYQGAAKKLPAIYKWNINFGGHNDPQNILDFLDKVDDLRESRGVTSEELFTSAHDLFSNEASKWLRAIKKTIFTWDELVLKLKKEFLPSDFEYQMTQQLRNRKQGVNEDISSFIMDIEFMYRRIDVNVSERDIINQILRNLNPFFASHIALDDYPNLTLLRERCKKVQELQQLHERYKTPFVPQQRTFINHNVSANNKPTPAFKNNNSNFVSFRQQRPAKNISTVQHQNVSNVQEKVSNELIHVPSNNYKCWNCQNLGHSYNNCTKYKRKFCFGCGLQNVTKTNCPMCSTNFVRNNRVGNEMQVASIPDVSNLTLQNRPTEEILPLQN